MRRGACHVFLALFLGNSLLFFGGCGQAEVVEDFESIVVDGLARKLYVEEFLLPVETVSCADRLHTKNQDNLLVGRYKDPFFGEATYAAFFQPSEVNVFIDIPASAVLESVVLTFVVSYTHLDTNIPPVFNLYPLTEPLVAPAGDEPKDYFADSTLAHEADKVAVVEKRLREEDSDNTLYEASLPDDWAAVFFNYFRGRQSPAPDFHGFLLASTAQNGVIIGFSPSESQLDIYYRRSAEGSERLTKRLNLSGDRFNRIVVDRAGSTLDGLEDHIIFPHERYVFLQGGTGVCVQADIGAMHHIESVIGEASSIVSVELLFTAHLTTGYDVLLPESLRMGYYHATAPLVNPLAMTALLEQVVPNDHGYAVRSAAYFDLLRVEENALDYGGSLVVFAREVMAGTISATHLVLFPRQYGTPVQGIFLKDGMKMQVYYTKTL